MCAICSLLGLVQKRSQSFLTPVKKMQTENRKNSQKQKSDEIYKRNDKSKRCDCPTEPRRGKEEGKERVTESRKMTAFWRASGVEAQSRAVCIAWATLLALMSLLPALSSIINFNCYCFPFFHSFSVIFFRLKRERERKRFAISFNPKSRWGFGVHSARSRIEPGIYAVVRGQDSSRLVFFPFRSSFLFLKYLGLKKLSKINSLTFFSNLIFFTF